MPSKNKCNKPKRNNHSVQQKNNRVMERPSLYPREIDRVLYLEDKEPNMVPINSARINDSKKPILPCINQSSINTSMNIFQVPHTLPTNNSHINIEVI